MLFRTPVVLQLDIASFGSSKLICFAQFVSRNAGVDEEGEMDDSNTMFVNE